MWNVTHKDIQSMGTCSFEQSGSLTSLVPSSKNWTLVLGLTTTWCSYFWALIQRAPHRKLVASNIAHKPDWCFYKAFMCIVIIWAIVDVSVWQQSRRSKSCGQRKACAHQFKMFTMTKHSQTHTILSCASASSYAFPPMMFIRRRKQYLEERNSSYHLA